MKKKDDRKEGKRRTGEESRVGGVWKERKEEGREREKT